MTHALVRRDVDMLDDPLRAQSLSLAAGCILAAIAIAVCGVMALVRPAGIPDSAAIVIARESGALFVRIGDTLHPVPNLASARLVARSAATPVTVTEAAIADATRGPAVGIPGAPATVGTAASARSWTVCDAERTVVAMGELPLDGFDPLRAVLVTPLGESAATTYLLYAGRRAEVDLRSRPVTRALRLDGVAPFPVSRTLLDVLPEAPAIATPRIEGVGGLGPATLRGHSIGSIVRILRADPAQRTAGQNYVVLADGVQAVGEVAADVIRFSYERQAETIPTVSPAAIAATPVVTTLPVETFPASADVPVGDGSGVTVCAQWRPAGSESSNTSVTVGRSPLNWRSVTLAQADGVGPKVDAVATAGAGNTYVRSVRIVGDDGLTGPRFLVSDAGVTYGIRDDDTATSLGLPESPGAAPWPILAQLPRGPELSVEAASVLRDGWSMPS